MLLSELVSIASIVSGFVAAVCFCVGAATTNTEHIKALSSTYWNFNKHLVHSLSAQRAQYAVGALLLVVSFGLQSAAVLGVPDIHLALPQAAQSAPVLFAATLAACSLLAFCSVRAISTRTERQVLELHRKEDEADAARRKK
jgi:hypothetical protein